MQEEKRLTLHSVNASMYPETITGSTDTISSIVLIGCCILSALVLVSSLSYHSEGEIENQLQILEANGKSLFYELLNHLTDIEPDGIRYFMPDWRNEISNFAESANNSELSSILCIRVYGENDIKINITGVIENCIVTKRFDEPALLMHGISLIPVELSMVVGL